MLLKHKKYSSFLKVVKFQETPIIINNIQMQSIPYFHNVPIKWQYPSMYDYWRHIFITEAYKKVTQSASRSRDLNIRNLCGQWLIQIIIWKMSPPQNMYKDSPVIVVFGFPENHKTALIADLAKQLTLFHPVLSPNNKYALIDK